jgi:tRNA-Thr(GGU) m(6)t(6)A37 methyltransferase TsaA
MDLTLHVIGHVRSPLASRADAPRQGDEGAPDADLHLVDAVAPAMNGITVGDELLVLTWLHQGDRSTLTTRPRNDPTRPETGVFATRSPDRPNPLGLHRVTVLAVEDNRLHVSGLEAIDGTPVVDLKPVLGSAGER